MPKTRSLALGIAYNANTNRIFGTIRLRCVENNEENKDEESDNEITPEIITSR